MAQTKVDMKNEYHVYILISQKDNKHYTGFTNDLTRRLKEHEQGIVKSTKNRRPLKLIYTESYPVKEEATKREKFFKSGKGREDLKKILNTLAP